MNISDGFPLTSEQCELLMAFRESDSLEQLARKLGRDVSAVSRRLQRIAEDVPTVLEKKHGRWRLTDTGLVLAEWSRDAASAQRRILHRRNTLRVASTREFSARVFAPGLSEFMAGDQSTVISVITYEQGVERALLAGDVDLGFDCGRAQDPAVGFKLVVPEGFSVLVSPKWPAVKKMASREDILTLPHLLYPRATATKLLSLSEDRLNVVASFNDIASVRGACAAGVGWAVLPTYTVLSEIERGELKTLPGWKIEPERFGVFWLRDREWVAPWVLRAIAWLRLQNLDGRATSSIRPQGKSRLSRKA